MTLQFPKFLFILIDLVLQILLFLFFHHFGWKSKLKTSLQIVVLPRSVFGMKRWIILMTSVIYYVLLSLTCRVFGLVLLDIRVLFVVPSWISFPYFHHIYKILQVVFGFRFVLFYVRKFYAVVVRACNWMISLFSFIGIQDWVIVSGRLLGAILMNLLAFSQLLKFGTFVFLFYGLFHNFHVLVYFI